MASSSGSYKRMGAVMAGQLKANPERAARFNRLSEDKVWDVVVIGGGATGSGIAVDAAARGFTTLLLDAHDFSVHSSVLREL